MVEDTSNQPPERISAHGVEYVRVPTEEESSDELQAGKRRGDGTPVLFLPPSFVSPVESPLTKKRSVAVELGGRRNAAWLIGAFLSESGWNPDDFLEEVRAVYDEDQTEREEEEAPSPEVPK